MKKLLSILILLLFAGFCQAGTAYVAGLRSFEADPCYAVYFESTTGWVRGDANTIIAADVNYVRHWQTVKSAVRLSTTTSTYAKMTKTLTNAVDVSHCDMIVSFHIDPNYDGTNLTQITMKLGSSSWTNEIDRALWSSVVDQNEIPKNGWYFIKTSLYTLAGAAVGTETGVLSALKNIQLYLSFPAGQTPSVIFDAILFVPQQTTSEYALVFDDGLIADYNVAAYLTSKGLKGNFAICPNQIGGSPGYSITKAQLDEMYSNGHLPVNHSFGHEYPWNSGDPNMTFADACDSVLKGQIAMDANGWSRGSRIWAVPGGTTCLTKWTGDKESITKLSKMTRVTSWMYLMPQYQYHPDMGNIVATTVFDNVADSNGYLADKFQDEHCLIVAGFHDILGGSVIDSNGEIRQTFKTFIDNLAAKQAAGKLKVITFDELLPTIEPNLVFYAPFDDNSVNKVALAYDKTWYQTTVKNYINYPLENGVLHGTRTVVATYATLTTSQTDANANYLITAKTAGVSGNNITYWQKTTTGTARVSVGEVNIILWRRATSPLLTNVAGKALLDADSEANALVHVTLTSAIVANEGITSAAQNLAGGANAYEVCNTATHYIAGGGLSFDADVNDYIVGSIASFANNSFTVSIEIEPNDGHPAVIPYIFGVDDSDQNSLMGLWLCTNGDLNFVYATDIDNSTPICLETSAVFTDGQQTWRHIVCVMERIADTKGRMSVYSNGILVGTSGIVDNVNMAYWAGLRPIFIGALNNINVPDSYFTGALKKVGIYNRALTAGEIYFLCFGKYPSVPSSVKWDSRDDFDCNNIEGRLIRRL